MPRFSPSNSKRRPMPVKDLRVEIETEEGIFRTSANFIMAAALRRLWSPGTRNFKFLGKSSREY